MASKVAIANAALTKAGDQHISTLDDSEGESARVISSVWDQLRDAELRARNWNFAMKRASLAALASAPAWGYSTEYQLPSDCLRIIQVGEFFPGMSLTDYRGSSEADWQVEGRKILTNLEAPLKIRYMARIEDTTQWDALFAEAFACKLAQVICERITQSNTKRQLAMQEYRQALADAMRGDAIENPPEPLPDDSWIMSRL